MARVKSRLVVKSVAGGRKKSTKPNKKSADKKDDKHKQDLLLIKLVDTVRCSRKKEKLIGLLKK